MKRPVFAAVPQFTEDDLADAIHSVEKKFSDEIEHIRYNVGDDWSGDTAIFTRVLLRDQPGLMSKPASLDDERLQAAFAIADRISAELRVALEEFQLPIYFAFRWVSEQRQLKDPAWQ
jgi:hypothetical protein